MEGDAEGLVLVLVPGGTEPELEAAVRDVIDRRRHLREHGGMAVGVAGDEHAEPHALRRLGERREGCPAFHAAPSAPIAAPEAGDEVIHEPETVEVGVLVERPARGRGGRAS